MLLSTLYPRTLYSSTGTISSSTDTIVRSSSEQLDGSMAAIASMINAYFDDVEGFISACVGSRRTHVVLGTQSTLYTRPSDAMILFM